MAAETPPGVRGRLLQAVHSLCVTEVDRLTIQDDSSNELAYLRSIPGAPYDIEFGEVAFGEHGLPVFNLEYNIIEDYLPKLQLLSAYVIAGGMGIFVSRDVKRRVYSQPFCQDIANMVTASVRHRHNICEQAW